MAIRTERGEEKMIRQVDFERRSLGDETAPWQRMEKATCDQQGRTQLAAKGTCVTELCGLPKCEVLGCSTGKDQEAHPNRWKECEKRVRKTSLALIMRVTLRAREELWV